MHWWSVWVFVFKCVCMCVRVCVTCAACIGKQQITSGQPAAPLSCPTTTTTTLITGMSEQRQSYTTSTLKAEGQRQRMYHTHLVAGNRTGPQPSGDSGSERLGAQQ